MSVAATRPRAQTFDSVDTEQPHGLLRLLVAGAAMLLAYGPLLGLFFTSLWEKPHYQYFPFVIAAFAWLLWERYKSAAPRPLNTAQSNWIDIVLPLAAGGLLLAGIVLHSPWCAMISLIVLVAFFFRAISRSYKVTNLWGIWILLWVIVPLPFGFDQRLTRVLQLGSSRLSSFVLDWFGVRHLMEGNTLWLQSKPLFVDEACSGIISMLSIVACAVVYAVVKNRTPLHTILLAVMGIAWAAIMNVARISVIALALERWSIDWSAGATHEMLSLVLFLLAFLALLSMDQVLLVCLAPLNKGRGDHDVREMHKGKWIARLWDAVVTMGDPIASAAEPNGPRNVSAAAARPFSLPVPWLAMTLFALAAFLQTAVMFYAWNVVGPYHAVEQRAEALVATDLPATLCGLKKVDFEASERNSGNPDGAHSRTYNYQSEDGTTYVVSFDYPFVEFWHELTNCYVGSGWELVQRRDCPLVDAQTNESWGYIEGDFSKSGGDVGALWFAEFDQFGTPYETVSDWNTAANSSWTMRQEYLQPRRVYQTQVWLTSTHDVTEAQRAKARELLLTSRALFRSRITEGTTRAAKAAPVASETGATTGSDTTSITAASSK